MSGCRSSLILCPNTLAILPRRCASSSAAAALAEHPLEAEEWTNDDTPQAGPSSSRDIPHFDYSTHTSSGYSASSAKGKERLHPRLDSSSRDQSSPHEFFTSGRTWTSASDSDRPPTRPGQPIYRRYPIPSLSTRHAHVPESELRPLDVNGDNPTPSWVAAAEEVSEQEKLDQLHSLLDKAEDFDELPRLQPPTGHYIHTANAIWSLFTSLPESTQRSLDVKTLRKLARVVTPPEMPYDRNQDRLASQMDVSQLYNSRIRVILQCLEWQGKSLPTDYVRAMHIIALFGSVVDVERLHNQFAKMYPEDTKHRDVLRWTVHARLAAIQAWTKAIEFRAPVTSRSIGGSDDRAKDERLEQKYFAASMDRRIQNLYQDEIDRTSPPAVQLLWSVLQDYNDSPRKFEPRTLQAVMKSLNLVRALITDQGRAEQMDEMIRTLLEGPYAINLQYFYKNSPFQRYRDLPLVILDAPSLEALVDWFARRGQVWKMIAAIDVYGRFGWHGYEEDRHPRVKPKARSIAQVDRQYFDSAREIEGIGNAEPRKRSAFLGEDGDQRSASESAIVDPVVAATTASTSNANAGATENPEAIRSVEGAPPNRRAPAQTCTYEQFRPSPPMPLDDTAQRSLTPPRSSTRANEHSLPSHPRRARHWHMKTSNPLFHTMIQRTIEAADGEAVMFAFRMYLDNALEQQNLFIRRVLRQHQVHVALSASPAVKSQSTDPHVMDSWTRDLRPPRTSLSGNIFVLVQAYARAHFSTKQPFRMKFLNAMRDILRDSLQRLAEEHLILTGRQASPQSFTPQEYGLAMRRIPPLESHANAPFAQMLSTVPPQTESLAFAPRLPDFISGYHEDFNARSYCYMVNMTFRRLESVLRQSEQQGETRAEAQKRKKARKAARDARQALLLQRYEHAA